ncbi:ankyrin repeat domain-containing protein [Legionella israelensis]|uniref:ankyrin repeat domain-containing protein n=1 Tax=Legionella israelensis TaxID=454 RepID=UPI00117EB8C5|nr:ankyrin repeat domain-containing protein [Legionella israelensis]QDP72019.1 ankyrin repeat domain-containing protein [Legionella israelensis]
MEKFLGFKQNRRGAEKIPSIIFYGDVTLPGSITDNHYIDFLAHRIPSKLNDQLTQEQKKQLYPKLYQAIHLLPLPLAITEEWQLHCLLGDMNTDALNKKDNMDANPAHYAAWSDDTQALDWVNENRCDLLTQKDKYGKTIAHYAALSGDFQAMQWVKDNYHKLLTQKDKYGKTIAHYAAWSGSPKAMQWVKDNYPELLMQKDKNSGRTIAHYAALSGNPEAIQWVKDSYPELLTQKDKDSGRTIAHYAVESGSFKAMQWVKDNYPELMMQKVNSVTIAHYAAWSGSLKAMQWVKDNYPELLTQKDKYGKTIAHYAAWSDSLKSMQWLEDNYPELMMQKDNNGKTIAHYAAQSGSLKAMQWVKDNYPKLLLEKDRYCNTIVHFALLSKSPEQFNHAVHLSDSPQQFIFYTDSTGHSPFYTDESAASLCEAMKRNFSLTDVRLPTYAPEDIRKEIQTYCERNRRLVKVCQEFKTILQGHYQQKNLLNNIPKNMLYVLFQHLTLPYEIDESIARIVFNEMYNKLRPETRMTGQAESRIKELRESYTFFGLIEKPDKKIELLEKYINEVCKEKYESAEDQKKAIKTFYKTYKSELTHRRNPLQTLFKPNSKSKTEELFEKIAKSVGIDLSMICDENESNSQVKPA